MSRCTTGNQKTHSKNYGSFFFVFFTYPVSSHGPSLSGYLLCRLPEVSGVRQPAVQLGQLLQHVGQLGEGRPLSQVVRPAGREDLLRTQTNLESMYSAHDISAPLLEQWVDRWQNEHALIIWTTDTLALFVSTHSDLLAEADLRQDLLYALSAPHLPDGSFHMLVGDWPVPSLKFIPNGAEKEGGGGKSRIIMSNGKVSSFRSLSQNSRSLNQLCQCLCKQEQADWLSLTVNQ